MTTVAPPALRGLVLSQRDKPHLGCPSLSITLHDGLQGTAPDVSLPSLNEPLSTNRRRLIRQVILFALLQYVVLLAVSGVIFLASHFPPKAANLDSMIVGLVKVETVLEGPRKLLLRLWPWESTPRGFGLVASLFNSLVWGLGLTALRRFWISATNPTWRTGG